MTNVEQTARWNGATGRFWAAHDDRYAAMLGGLTARLLAAADVRPPDRVLDVGCGCGLTTRLTARRAGDGEVLGVDLSEPMLDRARRRAEQDGIANVRFVRADAQTDPLPGGLDVVQSQLGVMFFEDPAAAFANLRRALRPGGRLAFVCWQEGARNERQLVERAAIGPYVEMPLPSGDGPGPFSLADPDRVRALLTGAGFRSVSFEDGARTAADRLRRAGRRRLPLPRPEDQGAAGRGRPGGGRSGARGPARGPGRPRDQGRVFLDSAAWLVTAN